MSILQRVNTAPALFRAEPLSQDEGAAMFRAVLNLFGKWGVTDEQAAILTDMTVRTYRRWKADGPGRISRDRLARLSNLIGIHKALRLIFQDPQHGHDWLKADNAAFAGVNALSIILGGKMTDLIRVRLYLDAERGGW